MPLLSVALDRGTTDPLNPVPLIDTVFADDIVKLSPAAEHDSVAALRYCLPFSLDVRLTDLSAGRLADPI